MIGGPFPVLRDRVERRTRPAREKLQNLFLNMSPRDRILLVAMLAVLCLVLLSLGGFAMKKSLRGLRSELARRQSQLVTVTELGASYAEASKRKAEIDDLLSSQSGTTLSAFLEKAADKVQIRDNIKQVRERSVSSLGDLEDKQYSVQVSKVSLEQLSGFLYEIEAAGYPLKVRSLKLKAVTVSGQKILDANLEISAFRIVKDVEDDK
jgi:type II secretory pathway component PulM